MQFDPRTVAREIPGILDEVFPQLTPGVVARFNGLATAVNVTPFEATLLEHSTIQRSMLFELACVLGEQFLQGTQQVEWDKCIVEALERQREYFDVRLPVMLSIADRAIAEIVGANLASTLGELSNAGGYPVIIRPKIPGFEWIASGSGDFSVGPTLIEVKCTSKRFSSADYRQVAIYWLLSFAASIEERGTEWENLMLFNPRSGELVLMKSDALLSVISGGRTKVDILLLFQSLVGSRLTR